MSRVFFFFFEYNVKKLTGYNMMQNLTEINFTIFFFFFEDHVTKVIIPLIIQAWYKLQNQYIKY